MIYNIEGAPALGSKKGAVRHYFDDDGISITSSHYDFGWEGKSNSGFRNLDYYYASDIKKENDLYIINEIFNVNTGATEINGEVILTRTSFSVGKKRNDCIDNEKKDWLIQKIIEQYN